MKKLILLGIFAVALGNLFADELKIGDQVDLSLFRERDGGGFSLIDTTQIDFLDCKWDEFSVALDNNLTVDCITYEKELMSDEEYAAFLERAVGYINDVSENNKRQKWLTWLKKGKDQEGILHNGIMVMHSGERVLFVITKNAKIKNS
ncbi:MAG: hypothetical protein LBK61_11010 [Spirochaetaceae bacterium]|jgi:hypothetical protein|nr:hypothetical protein [Spirochaetaceae bacterium]